MASVLLHQLACQWDCYLFHNQMLTKGSAAFMDTQAGIKAIDGHKSADIFRAVEHKSPDIFI